MKLVQDIIGTNLIKKVLPFVKDRLVLKVTKNGLFSLKPCFDRLEGESQISISFKIFKSWFLRLRSMVGQSINHEVTQEKRLSPSKEMSFC